MILDEAFAQAFAQDWIESWNAHDLERVLVHYTDDFEFSSPFVRAIVDEPSGTLTGKAKVAAYWSKALDKIPELKFELIDVLFSINSLVIYYHSVLGKRSAEWFWFDASGKVFKSIGHYNSF